MYKAMKKAGESVGKGFGAWKSGEASGEGISDLGTTFLTSTGQPTLSSFARILLL
jgi:hypothetical protein